MIRVQEQGPGRQRTGVPGHASARSGGLRQTLTLIGVVVAVPIWLVGCRSASGDQQPSPSRSAGSLSASASTARVTGSATATGAGLTADEAWLAQADTLVAELGAVAGDRSGSEDEQLRSYVKVVSGCSARLKALGPGSDRVQPVRRHLVRACADYAEMAQCAKVVLDAENGVLSKAEAGRLQDSADCMSKKGLSAAKALADATFARVELLAGGAVPTATP